MSFPSAVKTNIWLWCNSCCCIARSESPSVPFLCRVAHWSRWCTAFPMHSAGWPHHRADDICGQVASPIGSLPEVRSHRTEPNLQGGQCTCFFIRSEVYHLLNGFDEDYFAHQEEVDLCWRAQNEGYDVKYVGNSSVYHIGGATLQETNPQKTFLNFRNSLLNVIKNVPKQWFLFVYLLINHQKLHHLLFLFQQLLLFFAFYSPFSYWHIYPETYKSLYLLLLLSKKIIFFSYQLLQDTSS